MTPMSIPPNTTWIPAPWEKKLSFAFRGFSFITSESSPSIPKAIAGKESVRRLIHRSCVAISGTGHPSESVTNMTRTSPRLQVNRNMTDFLILLKIFRPCSIATTIVEKLSSVRIMSAAFLATSVPVIPMATPMSATVNDGPSFTPSPVIDTICPLAWSAWTIWTLCCGETLAKTR